MACLEEFISSPQHIGDFLDDLIEEAYETGQRRHSYKRVKQMLGCYSFLDSMKICQDALALDKLSIDITDLMNFDSLRSKPSQLFGRDCWSGGVKITEKVEQRKTTTRISLPTQRQLNKQRKAKIPATQSTIVKLKQQQRDPQDEQQKKLREMKDRQKQYLKQEERSQQKNVNSTTKYLKSGLVYDYNGTILQRKQTQNIKGLSTPININCRQVACIQKKSGKTTQRKFTTPSRTQQYQDNQPVDNLDAQKLRNFIDSLNLSKGVCFEGCSFNIELNKPKQQNQIDVLNNISQIKQQNKQPQSLNNTIYDLPEGWTSNLNKNTSTYGDSLIIRQEWKNSIKKQFRISNKKPTEKSKFNTSKQESLSPAERYDMSIMTSQNWGMGKSIKRIENQTTYNSLHQKSVLASKRVRTFRQSHLVRNSLAYLRN